MIIDSTSCQKKLKSRVPKQIVRLHNIYLEDYAAHILEGHTTFIMIVRIIKVDK